MLESQPVRRTGLFLLSFTQFRWLPVHTLVGYEAKQMGNTIQASTAFIVRLDVVPRGVVCICSVQHAIVGC